MYEAPTSLSPSRVESFLSCPLAFRFSSLDHLPDPPTVATTRGSLVHRALELLFVQPAPGRTAVALDHCVATAIDEYKSDPDYLDLQLTEADAALFVRDCYKLAGNYLTMEDPTKVRDVGIELRLEATVGQLTMRGIIDRLDLDEQGELVITDYKTGRAPGQKYEAKSLSGVHFYSFLCESVFGKRPASIRLMYLKSGDIITAVPTDQSTKFLTTRTTAVWNAVATACRTNTFQPRRGPLCNYCAYQKWCPEFGGDPSLATAEAPVVFGRQSQA